MKKVITTAFLIFSLIVIIGVFEKQLAPLVGIDTAHIARLTSALTLQISEEEVSHCVISVLILMVILPFCFLLNLMTGQASPFLFAFHIAIPIFLSFICILLGLAPDCMDYLILMGLGLFWKEFLYINYYKTPEKRGFLYDFYKDFYIFPNK